MKLYDGTKGKEKPIFLIDSSAMHDVFVDTLESRKFLVSLEDAKKLGGVFLTTPTQLMNALSSAKYLDFHAGNMQRLLAVIEMNIIIPKLYAGTIVRINKIDDKKLLADEMIIFAKATKGEFPI